MASLISDSINCQRKQFLVDYFLYPTIFIGNVTVLIFNSINLIDISVKIINLIHISVKSNLLLVKNLSDIIMVQKSQI